MKGSDEDPPPGCSAFFVPADIVHAWRRNQRVLELDRPADKQLVDKAVSLERAIGRDGVPPTDKQMIVARRLGEFLASKKSRDVDRTFTASDHVATTARAQDEDDDKRLLSRIPPSYRSKAEKLMGEWSRRGMTWDSSGNVYLKGKHVQGASLTSLLHHASSGRRRDPPTGFGHVTRYMTAAHLPPKVYANPRWRGGSWDAYPPSDSSTEYYTQDTDDDSTLTEKGDIARRGAFVDWEDLK